MCVTPVDLETARAWYGPGIDGRVGRNLELLRGRLAGAIRALGGR